MKKNKNEMKYTAINQIFDESGMFFIKGFDPYRYTEENKAIYDYLFDEDGYVNFEAWEKAKIYAEQQNCLWKSDIAKYIYSADFDHACKGNYSAIFAWR